MKELSIEEKAKRYDKVVAMAKECITHIPDEAVNEYMLNMFPELKETEKEKDARISKSVIRCLKGTMPDSPYRREYISWLEKQGESDETKAKVFLINKGYPIDTNGVFPTYEEMYNIIREGLEKQSEQNHDDKVELKFKVGNFIVNDYCSGEIVELTNDAYLLDTGQGIPFSCEHNIHLWTIEDAKEGDVLSYVTDEEDLWIMIYRSLYKPYKGHVHYHALLVNNNFSDKGTCCIDIDYLKPASEEQRSLLFAKMKDAGYKWNADKKELIKL